MNAAEKYAALKLLEAGLKDALAAAADEADAYRQQVRAKALETDYGTVTVTRRRPSVVVLDDDALLDWVAAELPNLIQPRSITAEARSWLLTKRFAVDGDVVLDPVTGEVVPFLGVKTGSEYLTFRPTAEARAAATEAVAGRLIDTLAASVAITVGDPA